MKKLYSFFLGSLFGVFLLGCTAIYSAIEGDYEAALTDAATRTYRGVSAYSESGELRAQSLSPMNRYYTGHGVAAVVSQDSPLIEANSEADTQKLEYLNKVGNYLVYYASPPQQYRGYHFFIIEDDEPAAYSLPGGFIMISTGMLAMCENEDELAAILAHELGHAFYMHAIRTFDDAGSGEDWNAGISAALEGDLGGEILNKMAQDWWNLSEWFASFVRDNQYEQEDEHQADAFAVKILAASGYDPRALVALLNKVKSYLAKAEDKSPYLGNHPDPDDRLERVNEAIEELSNLNQIHPQRTRRYQEFFPQN